MFSQNDLRVFMIILCIWPFFVLYFLFIPVEEKGKKYEPYFVNAGRDVLVKLPSGIGVNATMTRQEAMSLINNPRAGLNYQHGKEILEYISYREGKRREVNNGNEDM